MIYNLKKDNYKNFNVYAENLLPPRSYFIPFSSKEELDETDIRTERYSSSRVAVLSGDWSFKYYSKVSEIPEEFNRKWILYLFRQCGSTQAMKNHTM